MKTLRPASQSWPALRRAATLNPQFHAFQPPASSRAALLPLWVALITAFAFSVHGASLIRFESTSLTVDENAAEVVLNVWLE